MARDPMTNKAKLLVLRDECIHAWSKAQEDYVIREYLKTKSASALKVGAERKRCWSRECTKCGEKKYFFNMQDAFKEPGNEMTR